MSFGPLRCHQAHPTDSSYVEVNSTGHGIIKGMETIINKNKLKKSKSSVWMTWRSKVNFSKVRKSLHCVEMMRYHMFQSIRSKR